MIQTVPGIINFLFKNGPKKFKPDTVQIFLRYFDILRPP
jgi:hypothetical protein